MRVVISVFFLVRSREPGRVGKIRAHGRDRDGRSMGYVTYERDRGTFFGVSTVLLG